MPATPVAPQRRPPSGQRSAIRTGEAVRIPAPRPVAVATAPALSTATESGASAPAAISPGASLPIPLRLKFGRAFSADLSRVRIHTDSRAQAMARSLRARAFTIGSNIYLGPGEQPSDEMLIAHELAHVLQQTSSANVQRWEIDSPAHSDAHEREAQSASVAVTRGQPFTVQQHLSSTRLQRWGISDALDFFANAANNLPGFSMLTFVLGFNPINMRPVERSAANLFRAIIGFIPGGNLIFLALQRHGILDWVGAWLQQQLNSLGMAALSLRAALDRFLNSLSWTDVFHLEDVWNRARRIFTEPIDRIVSFLGGVVSDILRFIRDAILRPVARLAEGTRGYDLMRLVLGYDPITGDPYPRTPENVIGGFMRLIGQEEKWRYLQQSRAIPRAWAWFQQQIGALLGFVRQIPQLFINLWNVLQISDLLDIRSAFNKIRAIFGGFVSHFIAWGLNAALEIMKFIFEVLAPGAMPVLRRAAAVFSIIIRDPVRFVGNLVRAGLLGFRQFMAHIVTHLINGLVGWLTGALAGAGLTLPARWDLRGILSLVLQILGLTWQNIRQKLVRHLGETVVAALETTFDILITLVREGPLAAWRKILENLQNLQEMVFGQIREWVIQTIVVQAVTRILSMLNPAGAVIQAIIAIYNTIMFFRERLQQIIQVAEAFFNSIAEIAAGNIGAAANFVERTMGRLVPVVISFLARLIGLGGISDRIRRIVDRIRAPIDRALDRVVDWIVAGARRLVSAVRSGVSRAVSAVTNWWRARRPFRAQDGSAHELFFQGERGAARLMIASAPEQVRAWLAAVRGRPENASKQNIVNLIQRQLDDLDELSAAERAGRPPARPINAETAMQTIATNAAQLLSGTGNYGTEANPLQITDWRKYASANYAPVYLTDRSTTGIPQTTLQRAYASQASKTTTQARAADADFRAINTATNTPYAQIRIEMYRPHERKVLPGGGPTIGLTSQYQIRAGSLLRMDRPGNTTTPVLNAILRRYGFYMSNEGKAGDHIQEMQIGGPNIIENIWPLNSSVNSSGGSSLSTATFTIGSITRTMPEIKDESRRTGRAMWFIIRAVRSGSDHVGP
jgi:hypothetical protein